jgi:hypothetical protein
MKITAHAALFTWSTDITLRRASCFASAATSDARPCMKIRPAAAICSGRLAKNQRASRNFRDGLDC